MDQQLSERRLQMAHSLYRSKMPKADLAEMFRCSVEEITTLLRMVSNDTGPEEDLRSSEPEVITRLPRVGIRKIPKPARSGGDTSPDANAVPQHAAEQSKPSLKELKKLFKRGMTYEEKYAVAWRQFEQLQIEKGLRPDFPKPEQRNTGMPNPDGPTGRRILNLMEQLRYMTASDCGKQLDINANLASAYLEALVRQDKLGKRRVTKRMQFECRPSEHNVPVWIYYLDGEEMDRFLELEKLLNEERAKARALQKRLDKAVEIIGIFTNESGHWPVSEVSYKAVRGWRQDV